MCASNRGLHVVLLLIVLVALTSSCGPRDDFVDEFPGPTVDCYPDWSPDGSTIVYDHLQCDVLSESTWVERPESSGLWLTSPDGTNRRMFWNHLVRPLWSPDGQWLFFVEGYAPWRIRATDDSLARLPVDSTAKYYSVACSPDGNEIAVDRRHGDTVGIWLMGLDGSSARYIVCGGEPCWSPTSRLIAYSTEATIWVMDTNGTGCRKLYSGDGGVGLPAFSPDGSKVAFGATAANGSGGLYVVDTAGQNLKLLTRDGSCASWSPDGRQIVFVGFAGGAGGSLPAGNLYIMNADGSGRRQLTFGPQ